MPLDPNIPLSVRQPEPFNNAFAQLSQIRANQQDQQLRQQQIAQNDAQLKLQQQRAASAEQQQAQTQQIHDAADQAYQQIKGGNADAVLSTLKPEVRTLAEGWLKDFGAAKQARDAQAEADGKKAAKFIQATDYNPVVAATAIKLISDLHPEAADLLQHATNPEALKKIVDHFATLGEKPEPGFTLNPGDTRFDAAGKQIAQAAPKGPEAITPYQQATLNQGDQRIGIERQNAARMAATASVSGGNTNVQDAVKGMVEGTIPPQMPGRASKDYIALLSEAKRQGYDLSAAVTDWNATQKHVATLNNNQQTKLQQSIQTAASSVDVIDDLAKQWDGGKFPVLNSVTLKLAKGGALGPKAQTIAQQLDGQITDVTSELAQVYMGGGTPTDQALKLASKNLQSDWSKQTLMDMTDLTRKNLKIRSNSMRNVGVQGASATNPYAGAQTAAPASPSLSPTAQKAADLIKKYGGQ